MRLLPLRTILPVFGAVVFFGVLLACQSTGSDAASNDPMTAYASFSIGAKDSAFLPDTVDWSAGKQSGRGRFGCTNFNCTDTVALAHPLGSDTLRLRLTKLGLHFATFHYTQTGRTPQLTRLLGSYFRDTVATHLLSGFYDLREAKPDSFAKLSTPTVSQLAAFYARLVFTHTTGTPRFPDSLPKGMNADSIRKQLVLLGAQAKSTWTDLVAAKWGLDSASIQVLAVELVRSGQLSKTDSLTLFPPPPVRVLAPLAISGPVTTGGAAVGVSGAFSWNKGLSPRPGFAVRTASGIDSLHFQFPVQRYLPSDTGWSLAGNLSLSASREAALGTDTLVITLQDDQGHHLVATLPFEVVAGDAKGPEVRITTPPKDDTVDASTSSYRLVAEAADPSSVDSLRAGNRIFRGARCTVSVDLSVGENVFEVTAWDGYRNAATAIRRIVRRAAPGDTTRPTILRVLPKSDTTRVPWATTSTELAWTVSDDSALAKVTLEDSSLVGGTGGVYRTTMALRIGPNTFTLRALDARGNLRKDSVVVIRLPDTARPTLALITPLRDTSVPNSVATFAVTVAASDTESGIDSVRIGTKVVKTAPYSAILDLAVGANDIAIQAWDKAGNAATPISVKVTRQPMGDTTKPAVVRLSPAADSTAVPWSTRSVLLAWSVTDDSALAKVTLDDSTIAAGTGGAYQAIVPLLVGRNLFTLVAMDARGNRRTYPVVVVRQADTTKPALSRAGATRDTVVLASTTSLDVSWSASDNALRSVTIDGALVAEKDGTYARTVALDSFDDTIRVVATDSSGNQAQDAIRIRRLEAPTISPPGGLMDAITSAVFSAAIAVDSVEYSFDKTNWTKWKGSAIPISSSKLLYVRSRLGSMTSAVDSEVYLFPPTMSLPTGAYTGTQALTLEAPGALIEVSTDNGATWTAYANALSLNVCKVVQARSKLGKLVSKPIMSIFAFPPVLDPASKDDTLDTLRISAGAVGADSVQLSTDSLTWIKSTSRLLSSSGKVFARAWIHGVMSPIAVGNYTFRCASPRFWPASGSYGSPQYVVLSTPTSGAILQYSLDGGVGWKTYVAGTPVPVKDANTALSVRSTKTGFVSASGTAAYRIANINWESNVFSSYDTLRDSRTGQTYRTIKIGPQNWMAENLNFPTDSSSFLGSSKDSAGKYGRYYQWSSAMDLPPMYNTTAPILTLPHKGNCPTGWHVPSQAEFDTLRAHTVDTLNGTVTDLSLKSSESWTYNPDYPLESSGTNRSGFNLLAAGIGRAVGGIYQIGYLKGQWALLWTSTGGYQSWTNGEGDGPQDKESDKTAYRYPVRCIAD